jgi:hypothetical protein
MTRGSRTLGLLFVAVMVPTAVTLVWLGVRLLDQDRTLWAQRELARRQQDATTAARVLGERLNASLDEPLPHAVRFQLDSRSIVPDALGRVLWLPVVAEQPARSLEFSAAEELEYRGRAAEALAAYHERDSRDIHEV